MFCSAKSNEGNDGSASSLSGHLTYILRVPSGKFPSDPCSTF